MSARKGQPWRRWQEINLAKKHPHPEAAPVGLIVVGGEIIDVGALAQAALENDRRGAVYVSAPTRQMIRVRQD